MVRAGDNQQFLVVTGQLLIGVLAVHLLVRGQKVDGRAEVLRIDVGRSHIMGIPAACARKRGVECDGQEASLCQRLGIQALHTYLNVLTIIG